MSSGFRRPGSASLALTAALGAFLMSVPARPCAAQDGQNGQAAATTQPMSGRRLVTAGSHYKAGSLHRFFFGEGYRSLWTSAFEVEVLDLGSFAGGLKPKKRGGGKQTASLTFECSDGRQWKFRSIDKDPSAVLPEELRDTFVDALVQDQVSAAHPLGPLVVDPLAEAAGILSAKHRLVMLPDDERLGEFRKEFSGKLGFIEEKIRAEERPVTAGFENFHKLLDTVDLWKRLDEHPEEKVDAPALLRARLFDLLINDFDRHKDQWQWARKKGTDLWQPVPEDRDQAFVRYSGLLLSMIRPSQPRLVDFGPKYPGIFGLTWQGRFVDRRHLCELEWPQWQEAIKSIQTGITDATIDDAVHRLPGEYRQNTAGRTAHALKARLKTLPEAARKFYAQLVDDVEIHGTDKDDAVFITPFNQRLVQVRMVNTKGDVIFLRRFDPRETRSIRLYLKGGDDRVVREDGTGSIAVRAVGGKGEDALDDAGSRSTQFFDEGEKTQVQPGSGASLDTRPYSHPNDDAGNPARDWGRQQMLLPWLSAGGDLGVFIGGNLSSTTYEFRHHPYSRRHSIGAGYATGLSGFRAEYRGEFVRRNQAARFQIHARASELDMIRFYGFGNETKSGGDQAFFQVLQNQFSLSSDYLFTAGPLEISLGALAQSTKEPERRSFAAAARPYGFGGFGKIGPRVELSLGHPEKGLEGGRAGRIQIGGSFFPKAWSVERPFGEIHGEAGAFLRVPLPMRPTLVLRAGGKRVFGRHPFQEAAFVGGSDTLRGLRPQRYAGAGSAFASAELRLRLGRVRFLLPSEVGILGLADAGRVFAAGESSRRWHHGVGGGLWMAILKPENTVSLAFARSEGESRVYLRAGFGF